jgi:hypothetical protein
MAAKSSVKKSPVAEAGDSPVKAGKSTKQAKSSKPKPSKPSAGRPPGEGMFRETGDIEVSIPLHSIDPAPWNPKPAIFGSYKSGLETSLDYFGNRDRLKVWARPDSIGRYYVLDGNQRLTVLREQAEKQLFDDALDLLCKSRGIDAMDDEKEAEALRKTLAKSLVDDESHERLIRSKAGSYPVPCRVLADLDHADAVAFTTSFDRNSAKFDELKVLANMEFVERAKLSASDRRCRPDRPLSSGEPYGRRAVGSAARRHSTRRPARSLVGLSRPVARPASHPHPDHVRVHARRLSRSPGRDTQDEGPRGPRKTGA